MSFTHCTCRTGLAVAVSLIFLTGGFGASHVHGTEFGTTVADTTGSTSYDEILLKDGTVLRGDLIAEDADLVIFATPSLGRLEILRTQVERIARRSATSGVLTDPDQNSIMFCPTPGTVPRGDFYFRSFELFILNFGFGVTDQFDLSLGTLFPVSTGALMLSAGGKFQVVDRQRHPVGLAVIGNFTVLEESRFGMVGAVAGIGDGQRSLNLALNRTFDHDGDPGTVYIVGGDVLYGRSSKIFVEYFNSSTLLADDEDLKGFINLGFRWFGGSHSFSISAFRPLVDDSDGFIALPMIMYSRHW